VNGSCETTVSTNVIAATSEKSGQRGCLEAHLHELAVDGRVANPFAGEDEVRAESNIAPRHRKGEPWTI
jgi:hypothetical protein